MNSIHFVSFLYDESRRQLVCFDPGFNLYQNGTRVVIPIVTNLFIRLGWISDEDASIPVGRCKKLYHGRRYGVQYNGEDPDRVGLAADAFCQSWSLFFIISCILFRGDWSFVEHWCSIEPQQREQFIMERFFLPHVLLNDTVLKLFREHMRVSNPGMTDKYIYAIEDLYRSTMQKHYTSEKPRSS